MIGVISKIERTVSENLRGAHIIGLIQIEHMIKENSNYQEWTYIVAWQREDQCGTHQAAVNYPDEDSMLIWGHYDMSKEEALMDMLKRANYDKMVSTS